MIENNLILCFFPNKHWQSYALIWRVPITAIMLKHTVIISIECGTAYGLKSNNKMQEKCYHIYECCNGTSYMIRA